MAQGSYNLGGDEVKEESSWRYPLIIFFATLILCIIFLYHYVGPDVDEIQGNKPRPTIADEVITLTVGDVTVEVPANYTVFPRDRRDGDRESLSLYAAWPRMDGYVPARRDDFVENEATSRRIDILVFTKQTPFSEQERLDILYMPHTVDKEGAPFDHGLTRFTFKQGNDWQPNSGYSNKDMFLGLTENGQQAIIFCYPGDAEDSLPAECYRELDLTEDVSLKYYFKMPYLAEWQRIDARVQELVDRFRTS